MTESTNVTAAAPRNGSTLTAATAGLALLIALTAAGWLWRVESRSGELERERGDVALEQRLLGERLQRVEAELRTAQQRLQDAAAINRSLRDEVLGVAERAELVEQALKRVSDRGMENVAELRMNNAEFLLGVGLTRLRLFGDTAGAATALSLADAELAALQDPVVTGIRQSLARELAGLSAFPADARSTAQSRLAELARQLDRLPPKPLSRPVDEPRPRGWRARARALLGEFVRVRHIGVDAPAHAFAMNTEFARVDLRLQLRYAEAALMDGDTERFKAQIDRIRNAATQSFDLTSDPGRAVLGELDSLATLPAFPDFAEAGGALQQLRNLQGTRQLAEPFGGIEE